ncbi:MAG: ABC transporter permease [Bacteroidaceae bacterium]|nr:ABC transporter permease [Bacteroidaceae bacterium]
MDIELFIAKRLYHARRGGRKISRPATTIAQWGVSVGIIVMMLSLAIVIGFKKEVREKIIGFGGHIQVNNYETNDNEPPFVIVTAADIENIRACEGVTNAVTNIQKPGLLAVGEEFEGVMLKGIEEGVYDTSFFAAHMLEGSIPSSPDSVNGHWVALSKVMADKTGCKLGDKVSIYFMQGGIKARRMVVCGIYETHLYEMDNVSALTGMNTLRRLNGWGDDKVSGIEITTSDFDKLEEARTTITPLIAKMARKNNQQLYIQTIEELFPALFAWLGVLDRTVWVILVLVLGIAGFTMVSGLLIIILEKSNFIGILKAIGTKNISIRRIFIYYSCFIIGKGMLWGNIIAIALCLLQQYTDIVRLDPEMYYMNSVPIEFSWLMLPLNAVMFLVSVAMLVVPSMLISRIAPSKAIKFE